MLCALEGSHGHLNVCGLEKKKPYWPKANAVQKTQVQSKPEKSTTNPTTKTKQNQHHGCTQVTGEKVKRRPDPLHAAVLLIEIELSKASSFRVAKDRIRSKCQHLHAKEQDQC